MNATAKKFRLVTRSDFDGLVCAVLLKELGMLEGIKFVHPKDMQDGTVEITDSDITANLPYVPSAYLAFDHHSSEAKRVVGDPKNHILDPNAASAARVIYNCYGGKEALPGISEDLLNAVDRADSAQFSVDEIFEPEDWALLSYVMDPRTGLGRFRDFAISNYQMMMELIDDIRHYSVQEILHLPNIKARVDLYLSHKKMHIEQIKRSSTVHDNLVILNLQNEETIYTGNRFVIYALYPECNISIHQQWGRNKQNTVFTVGKSIVNRSSRTHIGALMLEYGGGGHDAAGTCQIDHDEAGTVLDQLIERITADG